ncbi:lef-5 [Cyclophragma undans nucleopolyhedrovirus]|uniref:Lef-5 n=1 Tax=Cyclophragma undans nucleopolyhedrovirus TaxID=1906244 RepID=A0A2U8UFP2_9ABAC|nr:lef-5 [Cyclophragma undans nucleopolyhedrovirus]AWN01893.1 lef-5 [Cyclophragma undans nucleopolyhedrovirus]
MSLDKGLIQTQTNPFATRKGGHKDDDSGGGGGGGGGGVNNKQWTGQALFKLFKEFRLNKNYSELIEFLVKNFPGNVKNKTFNFTLTGHLFHSLYAYVPSASDLVKERKQIRLQSECLAKLFNNTINDFKLYSELFEFIESHPHEAADVSCPCQLLHRSLLNTKNYVQNLNTKQFDIKPPKFKKELFDNILYKYSLNYKSLLLKKKEKHTAKKKKKLNENRF